MILAALVALLVFNRNGLLTIGTLRSECREIEEEIGTLEAGIDSMHREIERLRTDSSFMEKVVRETLCWGRPGEFLLRIQGRGDGADAAPPIAPRPPGPNGEREP